LACGTGGARWLSHSREWTRGVTTNKKSERKGNLHISHSFNKKRDEKFTVLKNGGGGKEETNGKETEKVACHHSLSTRGLVNPPLICGGEGKKEKRRKLVGKKEKKKSCYRDCGEKREVVMHYFPHEDA